MADLSVSIGSLKLKNPVLTASGTFGYGTEYLKYFDIGKIGGIITKTITLEERAGNQPPRIAETPAGILNSIGLANVGVERFMKEKIDRLRDLNTAVIVNIAGNTIDEYGLVTRKISKHSRVDAIEVNISCPNVAQGGLAFGTDPEFTLAITKRVRQETGKPVIVKLTPNVTNIVTVAKAAAEGGADSLSLINTMLGMSIDIETHRPRLGRGAGGLSGPAIKPIAIAKVYQVSQNLDLPLIGIGGIMDWRDAVEFMIAGATAIQVGTLTFVHPDGALRVAEGLGEFCREKELDRLESIVGSVKKN